MTETPIYDALWCEAEIRSAFADLRDTWEPVRVYTTDACPRCHVDSDQPCVTSTGRPAKARHKGRVA